MRVSKASTLSKDPLYQDSHKMSKVSKDGVGGAARE